MEVACCWEMVGSWLGSFEPRLTRLAKTGAMLSPEPCVGTSPFLHVAPFLQVENSLDIGFYWPVLSIL
jgi:hypothetical protein